MSRLRLRVVVVVVVGGGVVVAVVVVVGVRVGVAGLWTDLGKRVPLRRLLLLGNTTQQDYQGPQDSTVIIKPSASASAPPPAIVSFHSPLLLMSQGLPFNAVWIGHTLYLEVVPCPHPPHYSFPHRGNPRCTQVQGGRGVRLFPTARVSSRLSAPGCGRGTRAPPLVADFGCTLLSQTRSWTHSGAR